MVCVYDVFIFIYYFESVYYFAKFEYVTTTCVNKIITVEFLIGPDPECDKKCANHGWCNHEKICQCPEGYMGQYCRTALCYPQCMNGGNCTSPGVCSCPVGFQGRHCEGGM